MTLNLDQKCLESSKHLAKLLELRLGEESREDRRVDLHEQVDHLPRLLLSFVPVGRMFIPHTMQNRSQEPRHQHLDLEACITHARQNK